MFNSLRSFYTSNEWLALRTKIMLDRGMICEHCHKLIINKYDAIGHHKIELSMANVNDYNISLNPDNIMLVHHKCHNIIHERFGSYTPHRYLVYGSPLSGKSSYVDSIAGVNDLVISVDKIRACLSINDEHTSSGYLVGDVLAVRDLLLDRVRVGATKAKNIFIIGGYPYRGERERLCKELGLEPVLIDTSKEECMLRLEACTDRDKRDYKKFINDWFGNYS